MPLQDPIYDKTISLSNSTTVSFTTCIEGELWNQIISIKAKKKILKIGRKGCVVLCVHCTDHQPTIITFLFSPYSIIKCKRNPSPNFISRGGREQTLTLTTLTQFVSTLTLHWPNLCPKFFFVSAAGSKEKNNSRHISSVANLETSQLKKLFTEGTGV